ncbi:MAG: histidinol-phosphatase, partial [Frankiales bacterium]|nr:histidinol-phosphatase [Frankiales bacterium]
TYGGFDWMTATVGGLWDSLLSEGKPWWISANSDSHQVYGDTFAQGSGNFATTGTYGNPTDTGNPIYGYGDFWPGFYSNTVVGATSFSYAAVMAAIRAGRMYVMHGGLLGAMSVRLVSGGAAPATLGGSLLVNAGNDLELQVDIALADRPNFHGEVPTLKKVDLIVGSVTGPATDADTIFAPNARVVETFEVPSSPQGGAFSIRYRIKGGKEPFYLRLRGSDGKRLATGLRGAAVDPAGPKVDALGNADPWQDLWFYTNPIFVLPKE